VADLRPPQPGQRPQAPWPSSSWQHQLEVQEGSKRNPAAAFLAFARASGGTKVFSTDILKISVVTDKQEYRIYRKFIGDRNKISEEI
jgi:hypothetical protein